MSQNHMGLFTKYTVQLEVKLEFQIYCDDGVKERIFLPLMMECYNTIIWYGLCYSHIYGIGMMVLYCLFKYGFKMID